MVGAGPGEGQRRVSEGQAPSPGAGNEEGHPCQHYPGQQMGWLGWGPLPSCLSPCRALGGVGPGGWSSSAGPLVTPGHWQAAGSSPGHSDAVGPSARLCPACLSLSPVTFPLSSCRWPREAACGPGPAQGLRHGLRGLPAGRGGGSAPAAPAGGRRHQAGASALSCPVSHNAATTHPAVIIFYFCKLVAFLI